MRGYGVCWLGAVFKLTTNDTPGTLQFTCISPAVAFPIRDVGESRVPHFISLKTDAQRKPVTCPWMRQSHHRPTRVSGIPPLTLPWAGSAYVSAPARPPPLCCEALAARLGFWWPQETHRTDSSRAAMQASWLAGPQTRSPRGHCSPSPHRCPSGLGATD